MVPWPTDALHVTVAVTVATAVVFDVLNGFHDAANSIATVVSTRVLSPRMAVLWAAALNFAAMFFFAPHVAATMAQIVAIAPGEPAFVVVLLAGLLGAIIWDMLTWIWGLPTSSSHALVGGIVGAGLSFGGRATLRWPHIWPIIGFIPLAPLMGFALAFLTMLGLFWLLRTLRPASVDRIFRRLQLVSASAYCLGHGGNDAQKTAGVIVAVLVATGQLPVAAERGHVPAWILIVCNTAMAIGTAFGGWRIVKTMGMRVTKLQPVGGFCAEVAGAVTLWASTLWAVPVSTTHTITGAIVGVGAVRGTAAVRWGVAGRIVWAWVLTMPAAALSAAACFWALRHLLPSALVHAGGKM